MKHPVLKLIGAVILSCALLVAYYQMIYFHVHSRAIASLDRASESKVNAFIDAMNSFEAEKAHSMNVLSNRVMATARLEAAILRLSDEYEKCADWENAMVVTINDGVIAYPADSAVRFDDYADLFASDARITLGSVASVGSGDEAKAVICACPITDDEYYVSWTIEDDDIALYMGDDEKVLQQLPYIEIAYGGYWLDVVDQDGQLSFQYKSFYFENFETPEETGITREILEARPSTIKIDGDVYHCAYKTIQKDRETGIFLTPFNDTISRENNQSIIITAIAGIILATAIAWHLATQRFVVETILTKPMQQRYRPSKMRWMTLAAGCIGVIFVFMAGCVTHAISDVVARSTDGYIAQAMLLQRLEMNKAVRESDAQMSAEWYLDCARRMGKAVEADPGLASGEPLAELNDAVGATYVMLFDGNGREYACSARYTGFSLGTQAEDSTTDFRRLLIGVPELAHDPAVDERTGLYTQMAGVGYKLPDERYGALILAFEPEKTDEAAAINEIIFSLTEPGWATLVFDKESKIVRYSSDKEIIGLHARDIGVPEDSIRDRFMDTFVMKDQKRYGFSSEADGLVYYSVCEATGLSRATFGYGLLASAGFAGIYLILSVYLLLGYTNRQYEYYSLIGAEYDNRTQETVLANGKVKHSIDPSRRWSFSFTTWRNLLPEQIAKSVFNMALALCLLLGVADLLVNRYTSNRILMFIVNGNWKRGFNMFAIVAILLLSLAAIFALMILRAVFKLTSMALDTKGETICRLTFNLLQYATVLVLLFYGFEFLGIDVRALLAPLALVSLALSLGSRELVQDIIAGLTIVFEGEYQVGDVVDVGGYRGKVVEVGVRTTKLLGRGDNIKIISNRDVRNVLNMSRLNSWIDMEFTLSNSFPLHKIEEIMARELPEIGASIPDIISGPIYKGIVSMNGNKVTICVTCECNEEVSYRVQRELYAKFHEMFERESLPLA